MKRCSEVGLSEKPSFATSLKTAASRVVLPTHKRAGRVSLSTKGTICLYTSSCRTTVVPFLVLLAGRASVPSTGGSDEEELDLFKDTVGGNPVKAAVSGLVCVKCVGVWVEVVVVGECAVKEYLG